MTMSVEIPADVQPFIRQAIANGGYTDEQEVVTDILRLDEVRSQFPAANIVHWLGVHRFSRRALPMCYNAAMSETFPQDMQEFVQQAVANGEYVSEEDVVVAGLRALRELKQRHDTLRHDIQVAVSELDRDEGEPWDAEAIKAELDEQHWPPTHKLADDAH